MKRLILFILVYLLSIVNAYATVWYVDNAATGTDNGTSWTNAWPSFSMVIWGSSGVKAGDTLYISGGSSSKTYTGTLTIGASGTIGNPITVKIDSVNSSHNGKVVLDFDSQGDAGDGTAITVSNRTYIIIDGNVNGTPSIVIKNLRNIMDRMKGAAVAATDTQNCTVRYLHIINCNNGVYFGSGTYSNTVEYCKMESIRGDCAIAVIGSGFNTDWDDAIVRYNDIETMWNIEEPPEAEYSYAGPDGVQSSSGVSIYNNKIKVITTTAFYTSDQHPDMIQTTGNKVKIYNNEFINVGDSVIDYDTFCNGTPHDVWIYNNIFRIVDAIDIYPDFFRLYRSWGVTLTSITNFKIMNNTFVDNDLWPNIKFMQYGSNPTASGNEIKNNIFYNAGKDLYFPIILIDDSTGFDENSFAFSNNTYNSSDPNAAIAFLGVSYPIVTWVSGHDTNGQVGAPSFMYYSEFDDNNNFLLLVTDAIAKDHGVSLSSHFTADKNGISRPQGVSWDIGAYEYQSPYVYSSGKRVGGTFTGTHR